MRTELKRGRMLAGIGDRKIFEQQETGLLD